MGTEAPSIRATIFRGTLISNTFHGYDELLQVEGTVAEEGRC